MKEFNPVTLPNYKQVSLQPVSDTTRTDVSILAPIRTSIQRLEDARIQPEIKRLISVIWQTNEIHILFADTRYRDWETDRKSTRLNSSHSGESRMPSSA